MNTNKLAVVYVRVSTQYQVDNYSVQDQRGLASLAARYGFEQVDVREEQGVSAETITARPVMKGILEDISSQRVGAIIVSSFTRLTRDIDDIDGRIIKKTCRDHDCVIITPEKLYDFTNEADDDLADLQFFFSKIQKRMNLKPMIRGEYTKAKNGGFVGVPLSVGYEYKWKEETNAKGTRYVADLSIKEDEAATIRYIHTLFPEYNYRQIAVHLNDLAARGEMMYFPIKYAYVRERYGNSHRPWKTHDIRFIIVNDLYVGRMQYAVNSKSTYLRGLDPIYTYRQDLRIVSDEVFEHNQKIAALRRRIAPQTQTSPHLFSGVMRCPLCDAVMSGKKVIRQLKIGTAERYSYSCARYSHSGPQGCIGYWVNEREVINAVLPVLLELLQKNLRDHLANASTTNPLHLQMEGELKAELAKVNQSMKNLLEAVKQGALRIEQIREENGELQEAKRRLEKRLSDVKDSTRLSDELSAVLEVFDQNLDEVIINLMRNRLRFNTFIRLFFSVMVVEVDRPGMGWRKGKKKGELPECNARIKKFALEPRFAEFVQQSHIELPNALTQAECYSENRSINHGSPRDYKRTDLILKFIDSLRTFLTWEDYNCDQPPKAVTLSYVSVTPYSPEVALLRMSPDRFGCRRMVS